MDYPKTRKEAIALGASHYFTGEPCKRGHVALRKTRGACVECLKEDWKVDAIKRKDYFIAQNNSEAGKARRRKYYEKNREIVIARAQARPDEEKRAYRNRWKANNKDQVTADNRIRRKKHQQATPPWITREQKGVMREIYQTAMTVSRITGTPYVVDHIVPLRSKAVCGLHVPWNLEVITREENLRKSNSHDNTYWIIYTPEQPFQCLELNHASKKSGAGGPHGRRPVRKIEQGAEEGGEGVSGRQQGDVHEEAPETRQEIQKDLTT